MNVAELKTILKAENSWNPVFNLDSGWAETIAKVAASNDVKVQWMNFKGRVIYRVVDSVDTLKQPKGFNSLTEALREAAEWIDRLDAEEAQNLAGDRHLRAWEDLNILA